MFPHAIIFKRRDGTPSVSELISTPTAPNTGRTASEDIFSRAIARNAARTKCVCMFVVASLDNSLVWRLSSGINLARDMRAQVTVL